MIEIVIASVVSMLLGMGACAVYYMRFGGLGVERVY